MKFDASNPAIKRGKPPPAAFTLTEMLVVIAIIGILAALILPALSKSKQKSQGIYCLSNGKQMITALTMYTSDFHDLFPPNPDDANVIPGHNWCSGRAGRGGAAEFNPDILRDPARSLLIPYLGNNISVFHCPGDTRIGLYEGSDPTMKGKSVPASRTFSMSQAVGTICQGFDETGARVGSAAHWGAPALSVNGPWLDNNQHHRRDSPWHTYGKFSAIADPGPAGLWVFVDENDQQLNDAAFAFGMRETIWYDLPGQYHNGGCGFAFADGHSESHTWLYHTPRQGKGSWRTANAADLNDWLWMRQRTSANISGTMPPPQ